MKNRYDWNNPKEISNAKLYEVFKKASFSNKIMIYRLLNDLRRKKLSELWREAHYQNDLQVFLKHMQEVLKPLDGYIEIGNTIQDSDIKNEYEFWVVRGIAQEIGFLPLSEDSAINPKTDIKNFKDTRKRMIDILKEFTSREYGPLGEFYTNPLIKELESVEYIKPVTKKNWELKVREEYLQMLYEVGVGKKRASKIVLAIERWYKESGRKIRMREYKVVGQDLFDITYNLDEKEKKTLNDLSLMNTALSIGYENIADDIKTEFKKYLKELNKKGINEQNYNELYTSLLWKEKKLRDKGSIETRKADDFYATIQKIAIKKLYP